MAFLDNSGDIILDAVLTDVGRRRMAQGNFKITKFALGDDEIDYATYNKDHPSGSAYADLEILQTPVLEAFTQANATINYGLVSYSRNDLLYLPTIAMNSKMTELVAFTGSQNVIYLADDSKFDTNSVSTGDLLIASTRAGETSVLRSGNTTRRYVFVETGINNNEIPPTATNQLTYIMNVGLNDRQFTVGYDNRFINRVFGPAPSAEFSNADQQSAPRLTANLKRATAGAASPAIENYSEATVTGVISRLYKPASGDDTSTNYSNIAGARGAMTMLNFAMRDDLTATDYQKHGRINQSLGWAGGKLFDYIDTIVYVKGISTNITLQLPIRITRVVSTS
tara:strand:+ start:32 stop:1048 length:1017 start_codon:yes stop_codon:yes gene_type:complete